MKRFAWTKRADLADLSAVLFNNSAHLLVVGMGIHIFLAVCQNSLHRAIVESDKHWTLKIVSQFSRRCYTYLFLTATVLHWRGKSRWLPKSSMICWYFRWLGDHRLSDWSPIFRRLCSSTPRKSLVSNNLGFMRGHVGHP